MSSRFGIFCVLGIALAASTALAQSSSTSMTKLEANGGSTTTTVTTTQNKSGLMGSGMDISISSVYKPPAPPGMDWKSMLPTALQMLNGFGGFGGSDDKKSEEDQASQDASPMSDYASSAEQPRYLGDDPITSLGDCGDAPDSVRFALKKALEFRNSCNNAKLDKSKNIAINDYSDTVKGKAMMYIFDASGRCLRKTEAGYGNGLNSASNDSAVGNKNPAVPCADDGKHATPPGFHVTAMHGNGGKYSSDISLAMVGLEGQGSLARGILIHPAILGPPGYAVTNGCTSVCKNPSEEAARSSSCMQEIMQLLSPGTLVYNYFGEKVSPGACKCTESTAGFAGNGASCRLDNPNVRGCAYSESGSGSANNAESIPSNGVMGFK